MFLISRRWNMALAGVSVALLCARLPAPAQAYTPESPEVKAMIDKGIAYIEANQNSTDGYFRKLGGICLAAMAVYKWTGDVDHPLVKEAIAVCRQECQGGDMRQHDNYSVGIALIFLCDVDAVMYRPQIDVLLSVVLGRQKPHGGWGYPEKPTGDTSQTQYTALGTWMAARQNIDVPLDAKERLCLWLIRVQGPDGSYGYQGIDPGSYERVEQQEKRLSLQAAAMGSLYIATEMLGFVQIDESQGSNQKQKGLPALQKKETRKKRSGPLTDKVPIPQLKRALADGNRYQAQAYSVDGGQYQYYYMYGLERYLSFRELAEGTAEKEPRWYNDGVNYLKSKQLPDGSWKKDYYGPILETAFATLFLMRSTKKTIQKVLESGSLRGGQGLPDDPTEIRQTADGKIISPKEVAVVDDVLAMLEDESSPLNDFIRGVPNQLQLSPDPAIRARQLDRLRRLGAAGSFQARLTAINTLSQIRDLDNVPTLIYAVTDTDQRIAKQASKGLQFISRKFDGPLVTDDATPQRKQEIAREWKAWFLTVRPDAVFIE